MLKVLDAFIFTVFYYLSDGSKIIPKVTEIIPKYGSINGATRLTIKGEGIVGFSFLFFLLWGGSRLRFFFFF